MKILSKQDILSANDIKKTLVPIPEWGEDAGVYVKVMSGKQRDTFEASAKNGLSRAVFAAMVICDEEGKPLFTKDEIPTLEEKSYLALNKILEAGIELNKVSKAEIETTEKN